MRFGSVGLLLAMALIVGGSEASYAGKTFTVNKGQTRGPLVVSRPPYSRFVNNGVVTNKGIPGVPALTTHGNVTVINNGVIKATVTSGSTGKAVGVQQ
jgi:hypothetical protein